VSYILDALKRSEQERRQVDSSNLSNDMILIPQKKTKTQWWPFLLLAIFVLNIGAYVVFNLNNDSAIESTTSDGTITLFSEEKTSFQNKDHPRVNVPTKNHVGQKKIPNHVKSQTVIKKQATQLESSTPLVQTKSEGELIVPRRKAQNDDLTTAYVDSSVEQETKKIFINKDSDKLTVSVGDDFQRDNSRSQDTADANPFLSYPSLTELSVHFQKSIPSLIFNSHIYSGDPTARRVMINNVYLSEGQKIEGMTLHAIGEFEILLEKDTELFTMPVLRDWQGV